MSIPLTPSNIKEGMYFKPKQNNDLVFKCLKVEPCSKVGTVKVEWREVYCPYKSTEFRSGKEWIFAFNNDDYLIVTPLELALLGIST